jgi:hypothetical protein
MELACRCHGDEDEVSDGVEGHEDRYRDGKCEEKGERKHWLP